MPINSTIESIISLSSVGQKPDSVVALEINHPNISRRTVCYYRQKHNIPRATGLYLFQEGLVCVSQYEAMYDCYLHENNIPHTHQVTIKSINVRPDFYLINENKYVEIIGMFGYYKYNERLNLKKKKYDSVSIDVLYFLSEDCLNLYKTCTNYKIIYRNHRICKVCNKENNDLILGVCRGSCYCKLWRQNSAIYINCLKCNRIFSNGNKNSKYCSLECYHESLKILNIPSEEEILELNKTMSLTKIAEKFNIKPSLLYMRMHRYKKRNS